MLKVIELAFCCYAVTDMKRSHAFYEGVLGLKLFTADSMAGVAQNVVKSVGK